MKVGIAVILVIVALVLVGLLVPMPDYHYQGIVGAPIEKALQIQLEQSSGEVALTTYSSETDTVYITYNFWAKENYLYGLEGERDILVGRIMPLSFYFIMLMVVIVMIDMWS